MSEAQPSKNISPKRKKILIGLVALVVAVGGFFLWKWLSKPKLPPGFAGSNGRMEANTVEIVSKFSGRIEEILAREGDLVTKGQKLVRLDTRDLDAQLRQALADVDGQKQSKKASIALVAQRKSELLLARQNLARSKKLYVTQDISLQELQQDETKEATANSALAAAQADMVKSDAAIEAAVAKADTIKVNLSETDLFSPVDGRILYRSREPGEVINAKDSILTVLDLADVYMQFYLPTNDAGKIEMDAEGRILLDALPNRPIPAKVTYVETRSQFTPKLVETQSEREKLMFRVKINVDPDLLRQHSLKVKTGLPGMGYVRLDKSAAWPEFLVVPAEYAQPKH
ncbi:MAG: Multidrug resistance protein MdtA [Elusimicrobia bacterium]|nr:Multidrug resistance protein MdtA [Elusimicrobiota bacterium]